jgi:gamma-glutamyltranspeptidase/glutathione hydrolase
MAAAALMLPGIASAQSPVHMCTESPKPAWCSAVRGERPSGWLPQGRSEVMSQHGIVATSQPLAAQAGLQILKQGGNAIDAAVATAAVLSLTEPMNVGIAADLFAIVYIAKENKVYQLKASGKAPSGASVEYYNRLGYSYDPLNWGFGSGMPGGVLSAPVPGAAWGWHDSVRRFGNLDLSEVLEPAIHYAENGFPVSEVIANGWSLPRMSACADATRPCDKVTNPLPAGTVWPDGWKGIGCYPTASNVPSNYPKCAFQDPDAIAAWYIDGKPPVPGQILKNPDYGKALRLLATRGLHGFYRGEVARAIVAKSAALGGTMTLDDLATYSGSWVEAAHSTYKGYDIFETMAPSQAWNTGEMMNILEACVPGWTKIATGQELTLAQLGPANPLYWHLLVEAKKLSYKDLYAYNSDPDYAKLFGLPANKFIQEKLLSKSYAASLCNQVDPTKATTPVEGGNYVTGLGDTIYLTTADKWGNMVSWVNSNYAGFGQGIVVPGYGFPLCNRLQQFTMNPDHPNRIDPHKRPYNTISAGFAMKDGVPVMTLGLMGGDMQVQGHAQMLVNILDLGANLQASTDMARFYHNEVPNTLGLETQLYNLVGPTLKSQYGHPNVSAVTGGSVGGYQAIMFTPSGDRPGHPWSCEKGKDRDRGHDFPVNGFYRAGSDHRKDGQAVGW